MNSRQLISRVNQRMTQLKARQVDVALACGLSQAHLSKVLSNRVKLAKKTANKLAAWIDDADEAIDGLPDNYIRDLAARMERLRPARRMQFMQLLRMVARLLET